MKVCQCGKPATHRVVWNQWLDMSEPTPARRPSRCLACARAEAERQTEIRRAQDDRARDFHGAERYVYQTTVPVPHQWYVDVKQAARRHPEASTRAASLRSSSVGVTSG